MPRFHAFGNKIEAERARSSEGMNASKNVDRGEKRGLFAIGRQ